MSNVQRSPGHRHLARYSDAAPLVRSEVQTVAYPVDWLKSGRNLDFCLLAVCSCVLSLLCHQAPLHLTTANPTAPTSAPSPTFSAIDYALKTGLFTSKAIKDTADATNE